MTLTCTKCDGVNIADALRVATNVDSLSSVSVSVVTYDEPDALLRKKPQTHQIHARVCRDCGHTELYVANPETLAKERTNGTVNHK